jgi:hypothetical protein
MLLLLAVIESIKAVVVSAYINQDMFPIKALPSLHPSLPSLPPFLPYLLLRPLLQVARLSQQNPILTRRLEVMEKDFIERRELRERKENRERRVVNTSFVCSPSLHPSLPPSVPLYP